MEIKDTGILISFSNFKENFLIVRIFSKHNGMISGLFRKKKFNVTQASIVKFSWKARLEDQLGVFCIEVVHDILCQIMFYSYKLAIINSVLGLLKLSVLEREVNTSIFHEVENLIYELGIEGSKEENLKKYVDFEAKLLNSLGYGLDWSRCAVTKSDKNIKYISPKTGNAVTAIVGEKYKEQLFTIPCFLIDRNHKVSENDIKAAFHIFGHFINKSILAPNNLPFPNFRRDLVSEVLPL